MIENTVNRPTLGDKSYITISRNKELVKQIKNFVESEGFDITKMHLKEMMHIIENNVKEIPNCKFCKNPVKFSLSYGKDSYLNYPKYCSSRCSLKDPEFQKSMREGLIEKYGVDNCQKVKSIKEKTVNTLIEKYGVTNPTYLPQTKMASDNYWNNLSDIELQKRNLKREQTSLEKTGYKHNSQNPEVVIQRKETCNERYGGNAPASSPIVQEKIKQTNLEKYGVVTNLIGEENLAYLRQPYDIRYEDNYVEVMENRKNAFLEKWGVENPFENEEIKEKIKLTNLKNLGVENPMLSKELVNKKSLAYNIEFYYDFFKHPDFKDIEPAFPVEQWINHKKYDIFQWKCKKTGQIFQDYYANGWIPECPCCHIKNGSDIELLFKKIIEPYKLNYNFRDRNNLDGLEIDYYFPDKKIGFEINGLYFHSASMLEKQGKDPKFHHIKKTNIAKKNGIRLIQIFSDEIILKTKLVRSKIKNILGLNTRTIFARKCDIRVVDLKTKTKFLNKYHIQGSDHGSIGYGLYYKNRLVSLMTFGNTRVFMGKFDADSELYRYASIFNFNIVGGAGKLLSHYIKIHNPKSIVSYCDTRWSYGNLYKSLGFTLDHESPPNYWYTRNHTHREYRYGFAKHKLIGSYPQYKDLSESEIMKLLKFDKVWDCGSLCFVWKRD